MTADEGIKMVNSRKNVSSTTDTHETDFNRTPVLTNHPAVGPVSRYLVFCRWQQFTGSFRRVIELFYISPTCARGLQEGWVRSHFAGFFGVFFQYHNGGVWGF